jgi:hypothetical protein
VWIYIWVLGTIAFPLGQIDTGEISVGAITATITGGGTTVIFKVGHSTTITCGVKKTVSSKISRWGMARLRTDVFIFTETIP